MSNCGTCKKWFVKQQNTYDNDEVIIRWAAPEGKGKCQVLKIITDAEFGCNKYESGGPLVKSRHKIGEPWQHKEKGPCPDCKEPECEYPKECTWRYCPGPDKCIGNPALREGHAGRCVGTGRVYYYDDGYIGNNKDTEHPKEKKFKKQASDDLICQSCTSPISRTWNVCPHCGARIKETGESMDIDDKLSIMGS